MNIKTESIINQRYILIKIKGKNGKWNALQNTSGKKFRECEDKY